MASKVVAVWAADEADCAEWCTVLRVRAAMRAVGVRDAAELGALDVNERIECVLVAASFARDGAAAMVFAAREMCRGAVPVVVSDPREVYPLVPDYPLPDVYVSTLPRWRVVEAIAALQRGLRIAPYGERLQVAREWRLSASSGQEGKQSKGKRVMAG